MQEVITSFSTVMTWLILLLSSITVVLLIQSARHLQSHQFRAFLGVGGMVLVLVVTVGIVFLLAGHASRSGTWSQLLLPLVAALLMASLYTLTFPPLTPSRSGLSPWRRICLLLLTGLAVMSTAGLVLLDLYSP
jgi:L-asparagine transporter-like permease